MADHQFVRITDVRQTKNNECFVTCYIGDIEQEIAWQGAPPYIGDIYEIFSDKPPRKIASPAPGAWTSDSDALRWRKPVAPGQISRMEILRRRHVIRKAAREYLDHEGFTEIDAPLLVRGTTPDGAVESFSCDDHYLATSTEYQMKRLAMGGFEKIYSLTQNFRTGDTGTFRNPEFTMLEFGRVGIRMDRIEQDAEGLVLNALKMLGLPERITYQGREIDMRRPWERLSVSEAVKRAAGVPLDDFELATCRKAVEAAGIEIRPQWAEDCDFLFSLLMEHIQPQLGLHRPIFLTQWPMFQTTSAAGTEDEKFAERSELFIAGVELSDGFAGVADADVQQYLFMDALAKRRASGQANVELDQKYLDAMRFGAPPGAGMAMGFDRLVMLLTDQPHIKNVLAFAWDEL